MNASRFEHRATDVRGYGYRTHLEEIDVSLSNSCSLQRFAIESKTSGKRGFVDWRHRVPATHGMATTGPIPMTRGETPTTLVVTCLAKISRPNSCAFHRGIMTTMAAPSVT